MSFAEKVKIARQALNLSQLELAKKAGLSDRSVYGYEKEGRFPTSPTLKKLADALGVNVSYLLDEEINNEYANKEHEIFIDNAKREYGYKGVREAKDLISRVTALFAGGELNDEAKEIFFQSIAEVYFESKAKAREKFSPAQRGKPKRKNHPDVLL